MLPGKGPKLPKTLKVRDVFHRYAQRPRLSMARLYAALEELDDLGIIAFDRDSARRYRAVQRYRSFDLLEIPDDIWRELGLPARSGA
jgi:hypothetical protein